MNTFVITGMGRSGTAWLAHTLNTSPKWFVEHEETIGHPDSFIETRRAISKRAIQAHPKGFGMVNSHLRWNFMPLAKSVDYSAVIVRNPIDIYESMVDRGRPRLDHLSDSLYCLDGLIQSGLPVISFRQMTTSEAYLRRSIPFVYDFTFDPTPRNARKRKARLSGEQLRLATRKTAWFVKEYEDFL